MQNNVMEDSVHIYKDLTDKTKNIKQEIRQKILAENFYC